MLIAGLTPTRNWAQVAKNSDYLLPNPSHSGPPRPPLTTLTTSHEASPGLVGGVISHNNTNLSSSWTWLEHACWVWQLFHKIILIFFMFSHPHYYAACFVYFKWPRKNVKSRSCFLYEYFVCFITVNSLLYSIHISITQLVNI